MHTLAKMSLQYTDTCAGFPLPIPLDDKNSRSFLKQISSQFYNFPGALGHSIHATEYQTQLVGKSNQN